MRHTVKDKLKAKVRNSAAPVFLSEDFLRLGHCRQVSRALNELEKDGVLRRAGYGVFVRGESQQTTEQLVSAVRARLGKRVNRLVTLGDTCVRLGVRTSGSPNAQVALDALKLAHAHAILAGNDMATLRRHSLENLGRWRAKGSWCSAFAEWQSLMEKGSDADVTAVMTGIDEAANRLRQSAPYVGLLPASGSGGDAPDELLRSREADFISKNRLARTGMLEAIGEASRFYETFGYYVDPVDARTAILPRDWKSRMVNIQSPATNGVTGLCLDPHDLLISKVAAWRAKDIEFAKVMIRHGMVDKDWALALAAKVPNPEDDLECSARIRARIEGLFAGKGD